MEPSPLPTPAAASPSLARAGRGFIWSLAGSSVVLWLSFLAQIALGWLLSQHDFGVYAIAVSFSNMLIVLRDGGVSRWLSRKSPAEFDQVAGRALAVALLGSVLVAVAMVGLASIVGPLYGQPQVTMVMWLMAAAFPIHVYAMVVLARLQVALRFRALAVVKISSGLLRYGMIVALAWCGWGALSFAWPMVFVALYELILGWGLTRASWHRGQVTWSGMRQVFRESKWSLSGSFAEAVVRQCDYAVLGLLVATDRLGAYYFAFQLALQPVLLFSESLRKVVMPIFPRFTGDSRREARSLAYAGTFIGTAATPLLLLLAVVAAPAMELVWQGRWASAVVPLQWLCFAMPFHLLALFCETVTQARGQFRLWTAAMLVRGLGLGIAASLPLSVWPQAALPTIAGWIAVYFALSALVEVAYLLRQLRLDWRPLWRALSPPWMVSMAAALATLAVPLGRCESHPAWRLTSAALLYCVLLAAGLAWPARASLRQLRHLWRQTATLPPAARASAGPPARGSDQPTR